MEDGEEEMTRKEKCAAKKAARENGDWPPIDLNAAVANGDLTQEQADKI